MKTPNANHLSSIFPLVLVFGYSVNGIGQTIPEAIDSLTAAYQAHHAEQASAATNGGTMRLFQAPSNVLATLTTSAASTNSGPEAETARLWLTIYDIDAKPIRGSIKEHWKALLDRVEPISNSTNATWRRLTARILQSGILDNLRLPQQCLEVIDLAVADSRIKELVKSPPMQQMFTYMKVPPEDVTAELLNLGVYSSARARNLPEALRRARQVIDEFPEYARRENLSSKVLLLESGKNPYVP